MNELKIKQANNGYILSWEDEISENEIRTCQQVIENDEENENDVMKRMLEFVADHFGQEYDKWKEDNLNILFNKKGHKVE